MRQVWISRKGGPGVLEVREAPDPQPGPDEVRIRVRAAGVNFADLMARRGLYPDAPKLPFVPGYEVAGDIDAGPKERIGQRVLALTRFGGYSDAAVVAVEEGDELLHAESTAPNSNRTPIEARGFDATLMLPPPWQRPFPRHCRRLGIPNHSTPPSQMWSGRKARVVWVR